MSRGSSPRTARDAPITANRASDFTRRGVADPHLELAGLNDARQRAVGEREPRARNGERHVSPTLRRRARRAGSQRAAPRAEPPTPTTSRTYNCTTSSPALSPVLVTVTLAVSGRVGHDRRAHGEVAVAKRGVRQTKAKRPHGLGADGRDVAVAAERGVQIRVGLGARGTRHRHWQVARRVDATR